MASALIFRLADEMPDPVVHRGIRGCGQQAIKDAGRLLCLTVRQVQTTQQQFGLFLLIDDMARILSREQVRQCRKFILLIEMKQHFTIMEIPDRAWLPGGRGRTRAGNRKKEHDNYSATEGHT